MNQYTIEYEFMKEENLFLKRKVYIGLSHKRGSHAFYPCHANILSARGQAARQNKKIKYFSFIRSLNAQVYSRSLPTG